MASIRSLWTDDPEVFPTEPDEAFWWEVWLPVRGDRLDVVEQFKQMAQGLAFRVAQGQIEFPERTVLLVYGSLDPYLSPSLIPPCASMVYFQKIAEWHYKAIIL